VGATFPPGTALRDHASGRDATVVADGSVTVTPASEGLVLLERAGSAPAAFRWKNALVYFAITDRFQNGDPSNDGSYGRQGDGADEIGTWHGGDLAGLTARLDHLVSLGVNALWISPPVEQVHGWTGGGQGDFKHYAYAGYWALDFTRLDANFGTPADLTALVDQAHARGIRVVLDVVLNHPGYATGEDLVTYLPRVFKDGTGDAYRAFQPGPGQTWHSWNDLVNYASTGWNDWWSPPWVRAGFSVPGFPQPGSGDLTMSLASLPDFVTEGTAPAGFPGILTAKAATADGTGAVARPGATVRDYLVGWHADWVRQYGIDGFRCDTAKHVELPAWKALKDASTAALAEWKAANPAKAPDAAPFWMTGEVFPHGVVKDEYFTQGGFDSLINFSFQAPLVTLLSSKAALVDDVPRLEALYADMASRLAPDPAFDVLTYLSSHDTLLFFDAIGQSAAKQRQAGTALLLAPGAVQLFYGDETGRKGGPAGSDQAQSTRSSMNWSAVDATIQGHFQVLGTFRQRHAAVGAGTHQQLQSPAGTYAFSRTLAGEDAVVVVVTRPR